ncbi:MAG: hypothetical protein H6983_04080 [Ectothiorhodospiraceae bacterium]|nr:hypothetical protein [Chromatiales bacterium]MCP5153321.1 hypothetical protein [Ectothiorhodospiraceae bacterium]
MHAPRRLAPWLLTPALLLAGCASPDRVVFVTDTELGVGYDATVGNVNLGYDRNELVIGPAYPETGGVPPVFARLQSNASITNPRVKQLYATGDAARLVTDHAAQAADTKPLSGTRRVMVFGTSTSVGLKANFASSAGPLPSAVNFGYKRQEYSLIPLRADPASGEDVYGSAIAAIEIDATAGTPTDTGFEIGQFFATGPAAEALARNPGVRALFAREAEAAVAAVKSIPEVPPGGSEGAVRICRPYQARRGTDPALDAKLRTVESDLTLDLATFCSSPDQWTQEQIVRVCNALDGQGLPC